MHMNTVFVGIILFTAAITAAIAVADFVPARFVLANSAEVGVPRSWLPAPSSSGCWGCRRWESPRPPGWWCSSSVRC